MKIPYLAMQSKNKNTDSEEHFSETHIVHHQNVLEFLIDNVFVLFGGVSFKRQSAVLWVSTVLLFLLSWSFIRIKQTSCRSLSEKAKQKADMFFLYTFHCIDDVLSLHNSKFGDYVDTMLNACFIHLPTSRHRHWRQLRTKLHRKRYYFHFPIVNFLFICSKISATAAYRVYISPLIWDSRVCDSNENFFDSGCC